MAERSTEARHPGSAGLHIASGAEALTRLLDAQAAALEAVRPAIPALERGGPMRRQMRCGRAASWPMWARGRPG
jgi:N-acetylmuramic acid 6-phosphate (MurNAc-6-P) etherase